MLLDKLLSAHSSSSDPTGLFLHQHLYLPGTGACVRCGCREHPEGRCWEWYVSAHPCPVCAAGPCTHSSVRGLRSPHALRKDAELLCSPARSCACKFSLWTHRKFCPTLACWQTLRFSADITQAIGLNSLGTEIGIINYQSLLTSLLSLVWFIFKIYAYFQEASWKFIFILEMECFLAFLSVLLSTYVLDQVSVSSCIPKQRRRDWNRRDTPSKPGRPYPGGDGWPETQVTVHWVLLTQPSNLLGNTLRFAGLAQNMRYLKVIRKQMMSPRCSTLVDY